ncbi:BnaA05g16350D [Brassica napus]|uniref:BnaA05g16350D protein n=1 Tax=Brassica napus TaxID=3708 RepID=A0A078HCW4_BRANA|nr:BnaA05g16350D [Brassica napus]
MLGETSSKNPRISHVSISTGDICSEFGSSSDFANYTVHVPPTPDNNPAPLHIALQDIDTGSSYKDDDLDQTELRISEEEDALLYKVSQPLTRVVKISPIIIALYRILIFVRIVALCLFLSWRVTHKNEKAVWLWLLSVICEFWFAFSWLIDQIPRLYPVNHATDTEALKARFESPNPNNPTGKSDLPGIDVFVSTADAEKEPPLVTANTILSILSVDYSVEKLSCYLSDDGGSLLTFEAMAEAASFAKIWVPFCRKHKVEPRNPESYFGLKKDPYKGKVRHDFVRERRYVKRGYEEFKVRVNALSHSIRRRSDAPAIVAPKATWMSDGTHWPGTWTVPCQNHSRGDHASIIQVLLDPPQDEPDNERGGGGSALDFEGVDTRLPMFVYVSREKRPSYDHNKKAGAMNALVRASAIMSNGPFILNLDCDHYVYNSIAFRDGICFMMDQDGDRVCYVQFPQRFEGIDPSDRYANKNTVFFDINLRALDGIQGPMYVGTGCLFRRTALYGFDPPDLPEDQFDVNLIRKHFGSSSMLVSSVKVAEFQGKPLAMGHSSIRGRPPGSLTCGREPLDAAAVSEAVNVISCWYEDKTEWGISVGWVYGSVTEDVVTGFRMHEKGWRSFYCVTEPDAFRGSAPINLTDRLHQVLRWATGSVEIFFSRNNAIVAGRKLKFLQRISYVNVGIYPFTSIFILTYCFLPPFSLFSGQFVVDSLDPAFLIYLLTISLSLCGLAVLEVKWSGISLEEWWRNEQFWLIGGTSAHLVAVLQGFLKVIAGIEISFTLTSKSSGDDEDDEFADLYLFKWTSLMILPLTIIILNIVAILFAFCRTVFSDIPQWSNLVGGTFFAVWVLVHMYPFAKGLMGRRGRTPTIVYVWSGLIAICISLLYVTIKNSELNGGSFQLT